MDERSWLTVSCFFSIEKWDLLLPEIETFLQTVGQSEDPYYYLEFNYIYGDNIRLSILVSHTRLKELQKRLNNYFSSFFSSFPDESIKEAPDSIHLPFPSAIIRFDPFILPYNEESRRTLKMRHKISTLIIAVLKSYKNDKDLINTFCAYLQITLFKVCFKYFEKSEQSLFTTLLVSNNVLKKPNNQDEVKAINEMKDITLHIMEQDHFSNELTWINDWVLFLHLQITSIKNQNSAGYFDSISEFYTGTIVIILNQLNISVTTRPFLSQLIGTSLDYWHTKLKKPDDRTASR